MRIFPIAKILRLDELEGKGFGKLFLLPLEGGSSKIIGNGSVVSCRQLKDFRGEVKIRALRHLSIRAPHFIKDRLIISGSVTTVTK